MPVSRLHFEEELNRIHHDVLVMGTRVREDLEKAVTALRERDETLAQAVKADDPVINAMQTKIEDQVAILIATHQPVARDLRELVATIKLLDHLERIGDYSVHLAKAAIKFKDSKRIRQFEILGKMADIGCIMLSDVVVAFLNYDPEAARTCALRDTEIDAFHKELVKGAFGDTPRTEEEFTEITRLIRVSAFLERLGDHVTNICELVVYMVEGLHEELNA